jgi:circadian clock protein KaiB
LAKAPLVWELRLYVAGQTLKSRNAYANLKKICDENLPGQCHIEIVDLYKNPQVAMEKQIMATPTLIRESPLPQIILIGDLSDTKHALTSLTCVY